jgi:ABC-type transport system involved in Fe-S cluster assembly fused permease/ATPase subunit
LQRLEVGQYHAYLKSYMRASITTDRLSAILNMGQSVVLACGLTGIMVTALHTA